MKTILWDNDGVLVETEPLYYQASKEILAEVGFSLTEEKFTDVSLGQGESVIGLAAEKGFDQKKLDQLRDKRNDRYSELLRTQTRLRPGVLDCLKSFQPRFQMGIVTSSPQFHFNIIHDTTKILPFFNFVLTREGFELPKPSPDAYETAIKKWKLDKNDCVAIEDSERGVHSAKAAGIKCLAVPHALSKGGDFSVADAILDDFQQVQSWINRYF